MESRPEISSLISMLMDHREERMAEEEKYIVPYEDIIKRVVEELQVGSENEIIKIIGYLDVNSIAVRGMYQ